MGFKIRMGGGAGGVVGRAPRLPDLPSGHPSSPRPSPPRLCARAGEETFAPRRGRKPARAGVPGCASRPASARWPSLRSPASSRLRTGPHPFPARCDGDLTRPIRPCSDLRPAAAPPRAAADRVAYPDDPRESPETRVVPDRRDRRGAPDSTTLRTTTTTTTTIAGTTIAGTDDRGYDDRAHYDPGLSGRACSGSRGR